jgi:hypothetical protein
VTRGSVSEGRTTYRWFLALAGFLCVVFFSYLHPLYQVRNPEHGDQAAYLELAHNIRMGRGFVSRTLSPFWPRPEIEHPESVRGPLYPLYLSIFADGTPRFFFHAKLATLAMSWLVLLVSFCVLPRTDGLFIPAIFLLLLSHNRPFQTYATELWCENLLLLFCIPALFLIRSSLGENCRKPVPRGLLIGFLLGLGYLTKVSAALILASWGILLVWSSLQRGSSLVSPAAKSGLAAAGTFAVAVFPYLAWNRISIGRFFRDVDLRAAFWLDHGREYWLPHDTVPNAALYLKTHTPAEILGRLGEGFWRQGWNLVEAAAAPFPSGEAVGLLILGCSLMGLAVERSRCWRRFQITLVALTLVLAGWYARIDVTPRFIYLLVPLVLYNAAQGLSFLAVRIIRERRTGSTPRMKGLRWALGVSSLLFIVDFGRCSQPLQGKGYQIAPAENDALEAIHRFVDREEVLCMGPSHRLPYWWLIDRRTVFLPDFSEWDMMLGYFERFKVKALLIDQEIFLRRARMLGDYLVWTRAEGLQTRQKLPGMEAAFRSRGPVGAFFLFLRAPEMEDSS